MTRKDDDPDCLILGIGNLLMGDEGVGVHVVRHLERLPMPPGISCLDGGTGGLHLLEPLTRCRRVILVDATIDGRPAGTVRVLRPRYSADYPPTLTAHDIGLKDLLDAAYLTRGEIDVTLYAISIGRLGELGTDLSPEVSRVVPEVAARILEEGP